MFKALKIVIIHAPNVPAAGKKQRLIIRKRKLPLLVIADLPGQYLHELSFIGIKTRKVRIVLLVNTLYVITYGRFPPAVL